MKVQLKRRHLTGHTVGIRLQTHKLDHLKVYMTDFLLFAWSNLNGILIWISKIILRFRFSFPAFLPFKDVKFYFRSCQKLCKGRPGHSHRWEKSIFIGKRIVYVRTFWFWIASFSISSSVSLLTSEVSDSHSMDSKGSNSLPRLLVTSAVSHNFVLNLAVAE